MVEAAAGGGGGGALSCPANGATSVSALAPFSYNWIGGNISAVSALAQTLYDYVPGIGGVTATLDDAVQSLVGACKWTGPAASAFTSAYDEDAKAAHALSALTEDAGEIIDALAVALSKIESDLEQAAAKAKAHGAPVEADGAPPEVCLGGTTTAQKEAAAWLQWYQVYYQECMNAANKVRSEAASDLNNLPFPGVSKNGDWETALVSLGSAIDSLASMPQSGVSAIGNITSRAGRLMGQGDSDSARIMSLLSRNKTWQELGELGRSDAVELGGKFLLGAGVVLTGIGVYQQTHNLGEAATDAAGDAGISMATTWAGTTIGAEAGMTLGPVGALVGGGVGAVVGAGIGIVDSNAFNKLMGDIFG